MNVSAIERELLDMQGDSSLLVETNLGLRGRAVDFLSFVEELAQRPVELGELDDLARDARRLREALESVNTRLFARLRAEICEGRYAPRELRALLTRYARPDEREGSPAAGYDDELDILFDGLFTPYTSPLATRSLAADMVDLHMTPARIILELTDRLALGAEDVFYDLGSGLGQVALAVHLLSGAPTRGIEYEPAYCEYARRCAAALGVTDVWYICADVRAADLEDGTVFFMFTPFVGHAMDTVLHRLHRLAQRRSIRIATYGPCAARMAEQEWLAVSWQAVDQPDGLALFASR